MEAKSESIERTEVSFRTLSPMTKCLPESRMREIRTSGSTRGSDGHGIASRQPPLTLYSTVKVYSLRDIGIITRLASRGYLGRLAKNAGAGMWSFGHIPDFVLGRRARGSRSNHVSLFGWCKNSIRQSRVYDSGGPGRLRLSSSGP
jgi:hypothetical protein